MVDDKQKLTAEQEHRKELLLDALADFLHDTTEENFDEAKLDAILAELQEIDPMPPITDTEESLAKFHEMHKKLFKE